MKHIKDFLRFVFFFVLLIAGTFILLTNCMTERSTTNKSKDLQIKELKAIISDQQKQMIEKDSLIAKVISDCNAKN